MAWYCSVVCYAIVRYVRVDVFEQDLCSALCEVFTTRYIVFVDEYTHKYVGLQYMLCSMHCTCIRRPTEAYMYMEAFIVMMLRAIKVR